MTQVLQGLGVAPDLGKGLLPHIAGRHRHVRTRRDVAGRGNATVVLAGWATALSVVLQQGRLGRKFVENTPQMRRTLGSDHHVAGSSGRHAPGIFQGLRICRLRRRAVLPHALRMGDRGQKLFVTLGRDVG